MCMEKSNYLLENRIIYIILCQKVSIDYILILPIGNASDFSIFIFFTTSLFIYLYINL